MRIFKRQWGQGKASSCWYCEFKDSSGVLRTVKLFSDKRASGQAGVSLEKLVAFRQARRALDADLLAFVEAMPTTLREKLASWGLLEAAQAAAGELLVKFKRGRTLEVTGGQLRGYRDSMRARELAVDHIKQVVARCVKIIDSCGWQFLTDISAGDLEGFLSDLRNAGGGARTANLHLAAIKGFCGWLKKQGILMANPLDRVDGLNEETDRRHVRRDLTEVEISQLIAAAAAGDVVHGLTGEERALLYRLAIESGLRWNECYTLTRGCLSLAGGNPSLTVAAQNSKNRKPDILPLSPELAGDLRDYFGRNPALPSTRLFDNMWRKRGGAMLRVDLDAAGIPAVDDCGRVVDFHSLRHTCGSRLARAGVSPQLCQRIMRHSTMELTLKYYTHLSLENKAEALQKLPGGGRGKLGHGGRVILGH